MSIDVLWLFISFVLTLLIFSYIFGDNPLFRLASYAFVGVSAGYLLVTVLYQVLWPKLVAPLLTLNPLSFVPLVLGLLLLFKTVPRFARVGSIPMAYLVGVAAAVAIGGAIFGTLIGQANGAIQEFDMRTPAANAAGPIQLVEAGLLLLGTVASLAYFQFSARAKPGQAANRGLVVETLAQVGQLFIAVTLGALFAGVFSASITALIERLDFIQHVLFTYVIR
jgi:hypothetical protein